MRTARLRQLAVAAALVAGAATFSACGAKAPHEVGHTEGIYVDTGGLTYQVQMSRQLNPANAEDRHYLRGLPSGTERPTKEETWFAIFVQVENQGDKPRPTARDFVIKDTQGNEYKPLPVDPKANSFAYEPRVLDGDSMIPAPETPASEGPIQGSMLLYKLSYQSIADRPLELEIFAPDQHEEHAIVELDI